jgi:hypothetical protein
MPLDERSQFREYGGYVVVETASRSGFAATWDADCACDRKRIMTISAVVIVSDVRPQCGSVSVSLDFSRP